MLDDGHVTASSLEQGELEAAVAGAYAALVATGSAAAAAVAPIPRAQHTAYLQAGLGLLPNSFVGLDAGRPWLCYWILHALALLEAPLPERVPASAIVHFLSLCQAPGGGFAGGPEQPPHLAPTYAGVAALVTLGTPEALAVVDRGRLQGFLLRMCRPPGAGGGLTVCEGGEADVRACYTALAVAHMLGLDKRLIAERAGLVDYVCGCQTHEGGLGGEPGNEAHGGYAFCGLAALALLGEAHALDLPLLLRWAASCQGEVEGGFRGRTNKLVDGCYSYWQGALFPLVQEAQRAQQAPGLRRARLVPSTQGTQQSQRSWGGQRGQPADGSAGAAAEEEEGLTLPELPEALLQAWAAGPQAEGRQPADDDQDLRPKSVPLGRSLPEASAALLCQPSAAAAGGQAGGGAPGPQPPGAPPEAPAEPCLYNAAALQLWLLHCCTSGLGGMRDKPGKRADYYHTCYCLSGLAACQQHSGLVAGGEGNRLAAVDVACNVLACRLAAARAHFRDRPV